MEGTTPAGVEFLLPIDISINMWCLPSGRRASDIFCASI